MKGFLAVVVGVASLATFTYFVKKENEKAEAERKRQEYIGRKIDEDTEKCMKEFEDIYKSISF